MFEGGRLGVLGAGAMAQAMVRGLLKSGAVEPDQVIASRRDGDALAALRGELGVRVTTDNAALVAESEVVLLGVKPQALAGVLEEIGGIVDAGHTVISLAAGVTTATIEAALEAQVPVVRAMPNTPCLVGRGASVYCLGTHAEARHGEVAAQLLGSVGLVRAVPEAWMDAVTAVSGSGPAYVFWMMEAMERGARKAGLPEDLARELVAHTTVGAAHLAFDSEETVDALRRRVTSPGGTTEAALDVLDDRGAADAVTDAILAARDRGSRLDGQGT